MTVCYHLDLESPPETYLIKACSHLANTERQWKLQEVGLSTRNYNTKWHSLGASHKEDSRPFSLSTMGSACIPTIMGHLRPKAMDSQRCAEIPKTTRQNKSHLFKLISQVFCYTNRKTTNTALHCRKQYQGKRKQDGCSKSHSSHVAEPGFRYK